MDRKNFINLTPHTITLVSECGEHIEIEPSGTVARVETKQYEIGTVRIERRRFKVSERKFGDVSGLPDTNRTARIYAPNELPVYIVSAMVFDACGNREDIACPDTGESALRNEKGHIVAVRGLIMKKCAFPEDDDCAF